MSRKLTAIEKAELVSKAVAANKKGRFDPNWCDNCEKERPAIPWAGTLDSINQIRMRSSLPNWCLTCVYTAQLEHAKAESKRLFDRIPLLEEELRALRENQ